MSYEAAVIGFLATFALMALRVPIGLSLGIVGVAGYAVMVGPMPALKLLALSPMRTASDLNFAVVPLFVVMGVLARESGISTDLFRACAAWLGQLRGGLALATIGASAGFAAICGSSVATAATMTKIALPEMRRHGYDDGVATGTIAAGGTLGILIPPSVPFLIYGILTENDIGKLFVAGILPGVLATLLYMSVIFMISVRAPQSIPAGPATTWGEKLRSLKGVWASLAIFLFVIGGIYAGLFTALEAAGAGAAATLFVALLGTALLLRRNLAALRWFLPLAVLMPVGDALIVASAGGAAATIARHVVIAAIVAATGLLLWRMRDVAQ